MDTTQDNEQLGRLVHDLEDAEEDDMQAAQDRVDLIWREVQRISNELKGAG